MASVSTSGSPATDALPPVRAASVCARRLALHQFENQEPDAVGVLEPVDGADVGMIQRGEHSRFAFKAREPIGVARERLRQDLDGDVASKLRVVRPVHFAHAARTQEGLQAVPADDPIRHEDAGGV